MKIYLTLIFLIANFSLFAQTENKLIIHLDEGSVKINKHIYGHFSEHLGRCIYGGIWVGKDSDIPNVDGYRKDVLEALKAISIPNLRWPGGCFADEYHWMDGIGNYENRPKMVNTHWGGVTEDNSFGTHEFLNYCKLVGTEPYICGNVGSGTIEEMADWVEYINFDGESPMSNLRKENGEENAWNVQYWGVGNENWGCGGNMSPEYYADLYKRYATYCRNYGENKLFKIAGGANTADYNWTEVLMKKIPLQLMDGISLHYYTVTKTWADKGSATDFNEVDYITTLRKAGFMDELIRKHATIMDKYDPNKKVALVVDEWGTWHNVEPGTNPGFLYQQNSLRDAFVAGITLNIFNNHAERVKIANLAQTVNVLQALVLTNEESLILTPTYHVFNMYKVHQNSTLLPHYLKSEKYELNEEKIDAISVSCSKSDDGTVNISLVNAHPGKNIQLLTQLEGENIPSKVSAQILTANSIQSYNTFENPEEVAVKSFKDFELKKGKLEINLPAKSVVVLQISSQ